MDVELRIPILFLLLVQYNTDTPREEEKKKTADVINIA